MNQDPLETQLREQAWRHPLTPAEQSRLDARLATHPQERPDWEANATLTALLARLPERPAPSNLTARVLAEIERDNHLVTADTRKLFWKRNWFGGLGSVVWGPRAAVAVFAGLILIAGLITHRQQQLATRTKGLSQLVASTDATPLPPPEVLQDFDVINLLPPPLPGADMELLAVLQ